MGFDGISDTTTIITFFMSNNYTKELHMNEKLSEVLCAQTYFSSNSCRAWAKEKSWKLNKREPISRARLVRSVFTKKKMRNGCG